MGAAVPFISLASSVLGTGLSIAGQSQQAAAQANQAGYLAQVARNNQQAAELNAERALQQGDADASKSELQTSQLMARQRAALAMQGGDVNSGSNLDLAADTARAGATDLATIRSNAAWRAWGYRAQGLAQQGATSDAASEGADALARLPYGIGSSLLSGASQVAGRWNAAFGGGST